jgi:hypothetical protein
MSAEIVNRSCCAFLEVGTTGAQPAGQKRTVQW